MDKYLIVGLGNPGREYRETRHNIGFRVLDGLAVRLNINFSRLQSNSLVAAANLKENHLILSKPQTFMNLSGKSVASLMRFYKIPEEKLVIVSDDIDLPFGTLRIRPFGGSGGQNGMKSIIEYLKSDGFPRVRFGIGRPPGRMDVADYVLETFTRQEQIIVTELLDKTIDATLMIVESGLNPAMNKYNGVTFKDSE